MSEHVIRKGLPITSFIVHIGVSQGNAYVVRKLTESTEQAIWIAAQADTGDNVSATNSPDVLHEYKPYIPIHRP